MRVLITGATGFVGTHLRRYLLSSTDWEIVGTAFPTPPADPTRGSREKLILLDLRNAEATQAALAKSPPDYVVHLAAQAHVPTAYKDPWATLENNILGQLNLFESCRALGIYPRIIVIGSGEEYGRATQADLPLVEDHPLRPENPYSVSKVTQDVMGYQYFISYGLPVIRVRPFNHVGPGQSARFVLPAFASQVAEIEAGRRQPLLRVGNLAPERDFTDVRDVVRAYRLLLLHGTAGEVYNMIRNGIGLRTFPSSTAVPPNSCGIPGGLPKYRCLRPLMMSLPSGVHRHTARSIGRRGNSLSVSSTRHRQERKSA